MGAIESTRTSLEPFVGEKLDNGFTVIATKGAPGHFVVLATVLPSDSFAVMPQGRLQPRYATWVYGGVDNTFWGHYHDNILDAALDFTSR